MTPSVLAEHVSKSYRVKVRAPGVRGALRALVRPRYEIVNAIDDVSFIIDRGEVVAFLGPNGAGKTTTLKLLAGLLYPTRGRIVVAGSDPWRGHSAFKRRIALVLGNKQQLLWDLPAEETFELNRVIYDVPAAVYREQRRELVRALEIGSLLDRPVRQLSLGERMRCELAAALLHRPKVIFLDEPTLGLDVAAQEAIRRFLADYNRRHEATLLLTSHYMADVTSLASRVLVIGGGRVVLDGSLGELVRRSTGAKRIELVLEEGARLEDLSSLGEVKDFRFPRATLVVPRARANTVSAHLLASGWVSDLSIQDPPIDDVVRQLFEEWRPAYGADNGDGRATA